MPELFGEPMETYLLTPGFIVTFIVAALAVIIVVAIHEPRKYESDLRNDGLYGRPDLLQDQLPTNSFPEWTPPQRIPRKERVDTRWNDFERELRKNSDFFEN
jgi:hypothetical protein